MNLKTLILKAASGDIVSEYGLYNHYLKRMKGAAFKILNNKEAVLNALNDGFTYFIRKLQTDFVYSSDEETEAYLYSTIKNECLKHCNKVNGNNDKKKKKKDTDNYLGEKEETSSDESNKKAHVIKMVPYEEMNDSGISPEVIANMEKEEIRKLLACMPEGYRRVFLLYEIEGYSHAEIAQIMNISVGTCHSQLKHAKEFLKNLINNKMVKDGTEN